MEQGPPSIPVAIPRSYSSTAVNRRGSMKGRIVGQAGVVQTVGEVGWTGGKEEKERF